jgi:hypothetical protein
MDMSFLEIEGGIANQKAWEAHGFTHGGHALARAGLWLLGKGAQFMLSGTVSPLREGRMKDDTPAKTTVRPINSR